MPGKIGVEDFSEELGIKIDQAIKVTEDVEAGVYTYVHPNDSLTRHVTDLEKSTWNEKADKTVASSSADGLMSSSDKTKLDNIESNANNYVHPQTHSASMISIIDTSNLFTATDVEGALKELAEQINKLKS